MRILLFTITATTLAGAADFTFERDIRPILKSHCFMCHGEEEKLRGGVDLRLRRFMLRESKSGGIPLVPGEPAKSEMLDLVKRGEMPEKGKKLTAEEIAKLERWIAQGAKTARDEPESLPPGPTITDEERAWWSFQPVKRPRVPEVQKSVFSFQYSEKAPAAGGADLNTEHRTLNTNPVDSLLAAKLAERGLAFAPPADARTLIRRVTLDLTGLPPTIEEVEAFAAAYRPDTANRAYEALIDRLLASPHYGERWARHWLDAAGYSDSNGYAEQDSPRPHAWRYRDYVIRSINADKPWDRFIQEQLAGDELAATNHHKTGDIVTDAAKVEALTATGFLRMGPDGTGEPNADAKLAQNMVIADSIQIVGKSLLGLTVDCARCHDHRYDPVTQADYHRLRAIFEPAWNWKQWRPPGQRQYSLYTPAERAKAAAIEKEAATRDAAASALSRDLLNIVFEAELEKLPWDIREAVRVARETPRDKRTPEQKQFFKDHPTAEARISLDLYNRTWQDWVEAWQAEGKRVRATKPPEGFVMALTEMGDAPETRLFHRGDHDQPKGVIAPGELSVLATADTPDFSKNPQPASSGRRLAYARWLTSGRHPLVARVLVNQMWMHHFGAGLVRTPGDFGALGEKPTHPELLDWLAAEFVEGGWTMKRMHRLIVTSVAYRQSTVAALVKAQADPGGESARAFTSAATSDPDNRLLARFPLRRLDAETLRDAMLAVSGRLNPAPFGPAEPVGYDAQKRVVVGDQEFNVNSEAVNIKAIGDREHRRSIYITQRRTQPLTIMEAFDAPVMSPNCDARSSTTVAPQSLLLLNDTFIVATARALATRLRAAAPDHAERIRIAWRLLFSKEPSAAEIASCLATWDAQTADLAKRGDKDPSLTAAASVLQVLLSSNRFLYVE